MNQPTQPTPTVPNKTEDKKWLLWGLIGFTVILLITAIILFLQLRKPSIQTQPKASPQVPPVQKVTGSGVCETVFTVEPSGCTETCDNNSDCESGLECIESPTNGEPMCLEPYCPEETDCVCPEPSGSPSPSPSASPSPSPSPEPAACFDGCETDGNCEGDLRCMEVAGVDRCVNAACPEDVDCVCPGASASPKPSASTPSVPKASLPASPIARAEQPELPTAGFNTPAVLGVSAGLLLVILGLLF